MESLNKFSQNLVTEALDAVYNDNIDEGALIGAFGLDESVTDTFMINESDMSEYDGIIDEARKKVGQNKAKIKGEFTVQPWSKAETFEEKLKLSLQMAKAGERELKSILSRAAVKDSKILIDVKTTASIKDKVMNRGKDFDTLSDVLRSAILVPNKSDIPVVLKKLGKIAKIQRLKDKKKGSDKELFYHGSLHLQIEMSNGISAELQLMTKALWAAKIPAHDIYNELRSGTDKSPSEVKSLRMQSKALFAYGNR